MQEISTYLCLAVYEARLNTLKSVAYETDSCFSEVIRSKIYVVSCKSFFLTCSYKYVPFSSFFLFGAGDLIPTAL